MSHLTNNMAGEIGNSYNIYDIGFDKNLVRGKEGKETKTPALSQGFCDIIKSVLLSQRYDLIHLLRSCLSSFYPSLSLTYTYRSNHQRRYEGKRNLSFEARSYLSSPFFIKVLVEEINSSIYIISRLLKTNVYAHFWRNPWLNSLKKTCQVLFFDFVPSLKNPSFTFCSILLTYPPKIKLYQSNL